MKRAVTLIFFIFCFAGFVQAQQPGVIKGTVYKKISSERLPQVLITNKTKKTADISDNLGGFAIKAEKGDSLIFEMHNYTPQIQVATGYDMVVYMQPEIQLGEVTVKGQTKKQELNEIMGAYRSQGTFYDGKPPVLSMLTNPLTGIYELFGKTPGRARRFAAFAKREVEETTVDRRYNKAMVMRVTGATDSLASRFMEYYRPHYEEIKVWSDYDLINKVKKAYEGFVRNKDKVKEKQLFPAAPILDSGPIVIKGKHH